MMRYLLIIIICLTSNFGFAEEPFNRVLFAVHATDQFPKDGVLYGGYGNPDEIPAGIPNIRRTVHFSIGELVRPIGVGEDEWMTWENKSNAVVVPLESLYPQLINLNCYDTFILGDLALSPEMFLVAPKGTAAKGNFTVFEYEPETSLREAVDELIASQGGWKVTMSAENIDEEYAPALVDGVNINTYDFFSPLLEKIPYLSLGVRWEALHGEAWRFAQLELLMMSLAHSPEHFHFWDEVDEHVITLKNAYERAPQLSQTSKATLREMFSLVNKLKEQNQENGKSLLLDPF